MGLGKTIQAVSFIMALKHENLSNKPVLVIGPKSTLVGWEQVFSSCSHVWPSGYSFVSKLKFINCPIVFVQ